MNGTSHLVGADVGGTLTDLVVCGEDGILHWTSRCNCGGTGSASVESASIRTRR